MHEQNHQEDAAVSWCHNCALYLCSWCDQPAWIRMEKDSGGYANAACVRHTQDLTEARDGDLRPSVVCNIFSRVVV